MLSAKHLVKLIEYYNIPGTETTPKENKPKKVSSAPPDRKLRTQTFLRRASYRASLPEWRKHFQTEIIGEDQGHTGRDLLENLSNSGKVSSDHIKLDILVSVLSTLNKRSSDESCKNVLKAIYESGKAKVKFSDQEQIQIGTLLNTTIKKIFVFLLNFGYNFEPAHGPLLLKFRSALQFILDDYKHFKTEDGKKLDTALQELKAESDTIDVLDEAISLWKQNITDGVDTEGYFSVDLMRPEAIPDSHKWWNN
ncbi:hypothetical protein Btru_061062 [Bulinus truncatus]|nr:hypothetical protein Btru_061062 [Bulinus truncatus]